MEVGFLGLGIMGKAMSMNLLRNGFKVTVWNRTLSKCEELVEHGASVGDTPAAVVKKCKYTIAMLSDPSAALSVIFDKDGVLEQMCSGKGYIDMSTVDADTSTKISEAISEKGGHFLEAPVSGSKKPAEDGQLVILAAGEKVALSRDLCSLIVLSTGGLVQNKVELKESQLSTHGLHGLLLNTSIFRKRRNELHQVALQASNIADLIEVFRASLSVMFKQWSDAMHTFHEKFDPLSSLIVDHGLDSSPQEEFLSLLGGARTSPPVHQFLVNSLGEVGLKRVAKTIHNAGKELHLVVQEHLQPAAEIIAFRIGELRGLSRWRARYQGVGLDENMIDNATEKAGMLLVQVERFMRVLTTVLYQFQNFFTWLTKCIKLLMSELKLLMTEPSDQLPPFNCELVVIFLKFLYDQDPVRQLLEPSEVDHSIDIDMDTMQRLKEFVQFGGFSDTKFLQRTLAKEFEQMEFCFKEAFQMPFTTISKKIYCEDLLPLCPLPPSSASVSLNIPASISYYKDVLPKTSTCASYERLMDYICFRIPDHAFFDMSNCVAITRGFSYGSTGSMKGYTSLEAALLHVPDGYHCVDVSLYKENQIILLLNETTANSKSPENARIMMFQASGLPFVSVSASSNANHWKLNELKECVVKLDIENEKVRCIPHFVTAPLAVSASRGVACVFAARKRALVYILDEDEDETSDVESPSFSGM